jgi:hypothetical protein
MDPISVIVGALAAGALAGAQDAAQDAASSSVKDAYAKLKALIHDKVRGRQAAVTALAEHEREPEAWGPALKLELARASVDADPAVLARARDLLAAAQSSRSSGGDTWSVDARYSSHTQFGSGNVQYNQGLAKTEE